VRASFGSIFCFGIVSDNLSAARQYQHYGARLVSHGRYVAFQMAEVAVPRMLFAEILRLIAELRPPPDPAPA
jgi:hypothetical protein